MPLSAGHDVIEKDLHADPDQDEASRHLHPLPEDRAQPLPKEEQIVETSGAIWVETFKAPIFNLRMEVTGTTGLARDITQRKRAEEEKRSLEERLNRAEKMEALGVLAGSVAHDLNNVLGVIVGYSELLQHSEDKSSAIQPKLEAILKRSQRAAAIVEDLPPAVHHAPRGGHARGAGVDVDVLTRNSARPLAGATASCRACARIRGCRRS